MRCSPSFVEQTLSALINARPCVRSLPSRTTVRQSWIRLHGTKARPPPAKAKRLPVAIATTFALTGVLFATTWDRSYPTTSKKRTEVPKEKLFRLSDVRSHDSKATSYWVYRGDRVYDITEWIPLHPGGEVIMRAAGGSIDPYWAMFTIHQTQSVYDILEQYFIGKIDPRDLVDGKVLTTAIEDLFSSDPKRDARLLQHTSRPCNAETPGKGLESFLTPNELFYVRNHFWVPDVDEPSSYKITIELADGTEVAYSFDDLRKKFKPHTITATLQCSGNRRAQMNREAAPTSGLPWEVGGISTAEWTGFKLRDVLSDAGLAVDDVPEGVNHAQFEAAEAYGASIPIEKAVDRRGDVILAYQMNGKPLPPDHGYPLRVIVPGHVAARSVKWVKKIALSEDESWSQWQRKDYKCFGPNEGKNPNWDKAVSIQEMPVQSAITSISKQANNTIDNSGSDSSSGDDESVVVHGYAYSGGGRGIVRVDVSSDAGKTWRQAQIEDACSKGAKSWSWKLWRCEFPADKVEGQILVKAVDEGYNTQPESFGPQYNHRGNLGNAWHKVSVSDLGK